MSAAQAMTKEGAQAIADEVWLQCFTAKAAELGIVPPNAGDNELRQLVDIAMSIKAAEYQAQQKQASEHTSLLARAHAKLVKGAQATPQNDPYVRQVAMSFAQTPIVRQAAELILQG